MRLDDPVTNAKAESRALSDRLGRKERLKNAVRVRNSWPAVAKINLHIFRASDGLDFDPAGAAALLDGVKGVIENIQKDLPDLVRIGHHNRKILGQALNNFDIPVRQSVGPQLECLPEHGVNLNQFALRGHFP